MLFKEKTMALMLNFIVIKVIVDMFAIIITNSDIIKTLFAFIILEFIVNVVVNFVVEKCLALYQFFPFSHWQKVLYVCAMKELLIHFHQILQVVAKKVHFFMG